MKDFRNSMWTDIDLREARGITRILEGILYRQKSTQNAQIEHCRNRWASEQRFRESFGGNGDPSHDFGGDLGVMVLKHGDFSFLKCTNCAY